MTLQVSKYRDRDSKEFANQAKNLEAPTNKNRIKLIPMPVFAVLRDFRSDFAGVSPTQIRAVKSLMLTIWSPLNGIEYSPYACCVLLDAMMMKCGAVVAGIPQQLLLMDCSVFRVIPERQVSS